MRPIVILAIVGAVLVLFFVAAANGKVHLWKVDTPNEDSIESWKSPKAVAGFSRLTWPLTPRAHFDLSTVQLAPGESKVLTNQSKPKGPPPRIQMAKIVVGSQPPGTPAGVATCAKNDGRDCATRLCLCVPGSAVSPLYNLLVAGCPAAFRAQVSGGQCPKDVKSELKIAIYPDAPRVTLVNVGGEPVVATME